MSRILKRQLKRFNLSSTQVPEDLESWTKFLKAIESTYTQADEDRYLLERSLNISSKEMKAEIDRNRRMSLQLAQAGKLASLGTLASGVAHELNNPLAGIKGHAELLQIRGLNARNLKSVDTIVRLSERMAATIKHLLKLSRQSMDECDQAIDIREPIADSLELLKRQFETEDIAVNVNCNISEILVSGNQNTITGVFQNLFANSRDAFMTVNDGRQCQIKVEINASDDPEKLSVIYRDNAGGMSDEVVNKLFDPFFTTKDVGMGTGLGLAISRQVMEELGGSIDVKTYSGDGTEFILSFPRSELEKTEVISSIVDVSEIWAGVGKIRTKLFKALIIDDEEDICHFLNSVLGGFCDLTTTASSQTGLDLIAANNYDLVISDLKMPKISGARIAEILRENNPQTKLIFISGHIDGSRDSDLDRFSPFLLIEKPFPGPKEIIEMVLEYMQSDEKNKSAV